MEAEEYNLLNERIKKSLATIGVCYNFVEAENGKDALLTVKENMISLAEALDRASQG